MKLLLKTTKAPLKLYPTITTSAACENASPANEN
jgi:hypothetical protein